MDARSLTTDAVISVNGSVVLLERSHPPFEGHWVLPGEYVERGETVHEACAREVREEVGLDVEVADMVGLSDDPDRDERGNVSVAYRCTPVDDATPTAREEAERVDLVDHTDLPAMGFDHERIVADAIRPDE